MKLIVKTDSNEAFVALTEFLNSNKMNYTVVHERTDPSMLTATEAGKLASRLAAEAGEWRPVGQNIAATPVIVPKPKRHIKSHKKGDLSAEEFLKQEIMKLPANTFTIGDLTKALVKNGWSANTASPTLFNLAKAGFITRKKITGPHGSFNLFEKVFAPKAAPVEEDANV